MASRAPEEIEKNEAKYKRKYKSLKEKLKEAEQESENLSKKVTKYDRRLKDLKFEKSILLDKLNQIRNGTSEESDELTESEEEQNDRKRVEKDPNAPKRPANAFFMFCQIERARMREENQDASLSDITKMLGARWKELSDEEKKKYFDMYKNDKIRYQEEMNSYTGPGNSKMLQPENETDYQNPDSYGNEEEASFDGESGLANEQTERYEAEEDYEGDDGREGESEQGDGDKEDGSYSE